MNTLTLTDGAREIVFDAEATRGWIFYVLDGWYGQTGNKVESRERPQAHGAFTNRRALRTGREITVEVAYRNGTPDEVEEAVEELASFGAEGPILATVRDVRRVTQREVTVEIAPDKDGTRRYTGEVAIALFAADSRRYAVDAQSQVTGPAQPGRGLVWPAAWPLVWPGGGSSGRITLTNTGKAPSAPVFTLDGGFDTALITCLETGSRIGFDRQVPVGSSVVIDTKARRATIDGLSDVSRWLRFREWETVPEGASRTFQFEATGVVSDVAEVARNVATAPTFAAAGSSVEVARNAQGAPRADAAAWLAQAGTGGAATTTVSNIGVDSAPVMEMTITTQPTGGIPRIYTAVSTAARAVVVPMSQTPWGIDVSAVGLGVRVFADLYTAAGAFVQSMALTPSYQSVSANASQPTRLVGVASIPSTAERMIIDVRTEPVQALPGRKLTASRVAIGLPGGTYADGGYSPDPDLTPSWAGAVNESASVLSGVLSVTPIVGMSWGNDGTAVCIRSSRWSKSGQYSARIISATAGANSYQYVIITGLPAGVYTVVLPTYLAVAQSAPISTSRTMEYRIGGAVQSASAPFPNAPGESEIRFTFTKTAAAGTHLLVINQRVPSGDADLWVDDLTLVVGAYDGPAFTGDTPPSGTDTYTWAGPANASQSIATRTTIHASLEGQVRSAWW